MKRLLSGFAILVVLLNFGGCAGSRQEEQLLRELANMDKASIFQRGEDLYGDEKYEEARKYFSFVYDTFPNDPMGHKAALRIADTYAAKRDSMSQTEARLRYRDFANRYPNDPDRDYALLMLGRTHTPKKVRPDRELSSLNEAMAAYQQLINLYPNSAHVEAGRQELASLRRTMADHELYVARYYSRNKLWLAVQWRLEYLKENYPDYPEMEEVDALLEKASGFVAERMAEIERLKAEADAKRKEAESPED